MKRILLLLSALVITSLSFAQAPQGINYQGVARNQFGAAISLHAIGVQFKILQGSTPVYTETHSTVTDTFGLYSLVIGSASGTANATGIFSSIPWGSGVYSIAVYIDPNGGTAYQFVATSQLQSVPYALYSGSASSGVNSVTTNTTLAATGTSTVNLSLAIVPTVTPNIYGDATHYPVISVDPYGRVIAASTQTFTTSGGTVTNITVGAGLTSSPPGSITVSGGIDLPTFSGVQGSYGSSNSIPVITVDQYGRITNAASQTFTTVATVNSVGTSSPLFNSGTVISPVISSHKASTNSSGYLDSTDWNAFNNKVSSITTGAGILSTNISGAYNLTADNNNAIWNANQLKGFSILTATPTAGQVLTYTAGNWAPTTIVGSLPTPTVGSLLYSNLSNSWTPTNPSNISTDGNSITVVNTNTTTITAGTFSSSATSGNAPTLQVTSNNSNGWAIKADNTNGAAIAANSSGPYTILGNLSGGGGNAIEGQLANNSNANAAISGNVDTTSFGSAGYFFNDNPNNNARGVIEASTNGTGYTGKFTGGKGLLTDSITIGKNAHTGYVLTSMNGLGNASWQLPVGLSGGTVNYIPKWNTPNSLSSTSLIVDNGAGLGINIPAPNASAILDITSNGKGLLIPRIALVSITDAVTIPTPATSLLVYNTNAAMTGGGLGYWFWNGATWIQLLNGGSAITVWSLFGNAGTTAGPNFIGTTDAQPLMFKVNGQNSGFIDYNIAVANTALGYQALNTNTGLRNTATGYQALSSANTGNANTANGYFALLANTSGANNTAVGSLALTTNTIGGNNTAIGQGAMRNNSTGNGNTAIGWSALITNTAASQNTALGNQALFTQSYNPGSAWISDNVAIGYKTLYFNQPIATTNSGTQNTAIGNYALQANTTGYSNAASGTNALLSNTTGAKNTATGVDALRNNTTGVVNTATGNQALYWNNGNYNVVTGDAAFQNNYTGNGNTALGSNAGYNNTGSGNVFLGFNAGYDEAGSNKLYIANNHSGGPPLIYGDFSTGSIGLGNIAPGALLDIGPSNVATSLRVTNTNTSLGTAGYFNNTSATNTSTALLVSTAGNAFSGQFSGGKGLQTDIFTMTNGAIAGGVLTSNGAGNATWQMPTVANGINGLSGSGTISLGGALTVATTISQGSNNMIFNATTGNVQIINSASGGSPALNVSTNSGGGLGGSFQINNAANTQSALYATTNGTGNALQAVNTGTAGIAGNFQITTAGNASPALFATTSGGGNSGKFIGGLGLQTDAFTMTNTSGTVGAVLTSNNTTGGAAWVAPVNFAAVQSSTSVGNAVLTNIIFPTVEYNNSGSYNGATGVFTAPVAGVYHFDVGLALTNSGAYDFQIQLLKNGGTFRDSYIKTQVGQNGNVLSADMALTSGQTVQVAVYQTSGVANPVNASTTYVFFTGHLIH